LASLQTPLEILTSSYERPYYNILLSQYLALTEASRNFCISSRSFDSIAVAN